MKLGDPFRDTRLEGKNLQWYVYGYTIRRGKTFRNLYRLRKVGRKGSR